MHAQLNMALRKKTIWLSLAVVWLTAGLTLQAADKPVYENDFEKADLDKIPADMMVLEGGFKVVTFENNKVLELPAAPLDTFGVLFASSEADGIQVQARIHSTNQGRRTPTFAVGLNGVGGYKLQVSAGKGKIELYKGDTVTASIPWKWVPGAWLVLKLQSRKGADGAVKVEGKAWPHGETEPKEWAIVFEDKEPANPGRPSIWGSPFATTPIHYDDLVVTKVISK